MIEWVDQEGIKYLVAAVIGLGALLAKQVIGRLDRLATKVDDLHDDMIRVKHSLGIDNGKERASR